MKNKILISLCVASALMAAPTPFTTKEAHSLGLAKAWLENDVKSYTGKDGSVNFIFGSTMPSVIAAPLRLSDIQLEPGEFIKDVQIGDVVRWMLSAAVSGSGDDMVSHVIIKPIEANLETTLMIATDRRTYHLNLTSRKNDYMPIVGFTYTSDLKKSLAKYQAQVDSYSKAKQFEVKPGENPTFGNIDTLSFDYRLSGDNPTWKPIRVYNDGVKTYIQMPTIMLFSEAPVLMVLDSSGGKQVVNYRLLEDRFIVDQIFSKAVLFMDVGDNEKAVIIENKSPRISSGDKSSNELNALTSGNPSTAMNKLTGVKR